MTRLVAIIRHLFETAWDFVIGRECVKIRYTFSAFTDDFGPYHNEILTIFTRDLVFVQGALQFPRIHSTSVSEPCAAYNRVRILNVCLKYHGDIGIQAECIRRLYASVAGMALLPVVRVFRVA